MSPWIGSRPNDRHFDHDVVKTFRFHPGNVAIWARLPNLENADRVLAVLQI